MKKVHAPRSCWSLLSLLLLTLAVTTVAARADEITFSFVSPSGNLQDVVANSAGFMAGPGDNLLITDSVSGVSIPVSGLVTMSTGSASSFKILPAVVLASFTAGGVDSVSIVDPITKAPILLGNTNSLATMVATYPGGTGVMLSSFQVTFVDPAVLSLFGLKSFDSRGSYDLTFGQDELLGSTLKGVEGGGTITITATATPELGTLGLAGTGLLAAAGFLRRTKTGSP